MLIVVRYPSLLDESGACTLSVLSERCWCKTCILLDGVLVANELIDSRKRSIKEGVNSKIELNKVYLHVEWKF